MQEKMWDFWLFALLPALLMWENSPCTKIPSLHLSSLCLPCPIPQNVICNSEFWRMADVLQPYLWEALTFHLARKGYFGAVNCKKMLNYPSSKSHGSPLLDLFAPSCLKGIFSPTCSDNGHSQNTPKTQTTLHLQTQIQTNHHLDLRISGLSGLFCLACREFWWLWCSPWDAGRAMSAWCWWRVWAGPPVCSWTSCPHHQGGRWDPGSPVRGEEWGENWLKMVMGNSKNEQSQPKMRVGWVEKKPGTYRSQTPFPAPP